MQQVAQEPVGVEDVEEVLPVLIEGHVGDEQVDVEIDVARIQQGAAGQPVIDPVVKLLMAAVRPTVVVDHPHNALVDILGREEEPVVVEPQGALKLAKISRHLDEPPVAVGSRG